MLYEFKYDTDSKCLMTKMCGVLNTLAVTEHIAKVAKLAEEYNCSLILNDWRKVVLQMSTIEIYDIPKLVRNAGVSCSMKRAYLVHEVGILYNFFETVSVNQYQQVRLFTDFDNAATWLGIS